MSKRWSNQGRLMRVRQRVQELRWTPAGELRPNPRNWRTHPEFQQQALRGVLTEVGFADALIARQLEDGSLELIDGHLRAEILPDERLPVLVLDVDESEADKLLASLDPLGALAGSQADAVQTLRERLTTDCEQLRQVFDRLERLTFPEPAPIAQLAGAGELSAAEESYQLVVECADESAQQALYERLTSEGHRCRVLTL